MSSGLRMTVHPQEPWWKPRVPDDAVCALIGWIREVAPVDSGVPFDVKHALANALTRQYLLTFVGDRPTAETEWVNLGDRWVRSAKPAGGWRGLSSAGLSLVATANPSAAQALFESGGLWNRENQIVLLSANGARPLQLDFDVLDALMKSSRPDLRELAVLGVLGVMTPGPDGDFAQVMVWNTKGLLHFTDQLRADAEAAGLSFLVVPEAEFKQTKWFLEEVRR
jgi:hypothetical protein